MDGLHGWVGGRGQNTVAALEFAKGDASTWDPKNTVIVVLSAIIGAILGSVFGGIAGGVIGFLLGALISFVAIEFSEGNFNKDNAIASLRIALFAILGLVLGTMFGGLTGGVIGLVVGLTFGFASVAFDMGAFLMPHRNAVWWWSW